MENNSTFFYFAYGSNLLTKRIHINNPSAKKVDVAELQGYKLNFNHFSQRWKGAVATITKDNNAHVLGVLWCLDIEDLANLDKQEGVENGIYQPIEVSVKTMGGSVYNARSYQLTTCKKADCKPSLVYLNVIINGAIEHHFPQEYVDALKKIETNGYNGIVDVNLSLSANSH